MRPRITFWFSDLYKLFYTKVLPGGLGNRGKEAFISVEQGSKGQFLREPGEQRQYLGTGSNATGA